MADLGLGLGVPINNVEWGRRLSRFHVCASRVNKTFRFYSNSQANTISKAFVLPRLGRGYIGKSHMERHCKKLPLKSCEQYLSIFIRKSR